MGCITSTTERTDRLTLYFAGIKKPKSCKTTVEIYNNFSVHRIQTSLKSTDTIGKLKKFIHKTYKIPSEYNLFILYSHHIISNEDTLTLKHLNITNNSLLLLAITVSAASTSTLSTPSTLSILNSPIIQPHQIPVELFEDDDIMEDIVIEHQRRPTIRIRDVSQIQQIITQDIETSDDSDDDDDDIALTPIPRGRPLYHRRDPTLDHRSVPSLFRIPSRPNNANLASMQQTHINSINEENERIQDQLQNAIAMLQEEMNAELEAALNNVESFEDELNNIEEQEITEDMINELEDDEDDLTTEYSTSSNDADGNVQQSLIPPPIPSTPLPPPRSTFLHRRNATIFPQPPLQISHSIDSLPDTPRVQPLRSRHEPVPLPQITIPRVSLINQLHSPRTPPPRDIPQSHQVFANMLDETEEIKEADIINQLSPTPSDTIPSLQSNIPSNSTVMSLDLVPMKGFDIIMQEEDVLVYKMPHCGHVMNKESLYEYAINFFQDPNNVYLTCPHPDDEEQKTKDLDYWPCHQCTFHNSLNLTQCKICNAAKPERKPYCGCKWEYSLIKQVFKNGVSVSIYDEEEDDIQKFIKLELLASRNKIQNECNVQKCPQCETLYVREKEDAEIKSKKDLERVFKTKCVCCRDTEFCWGCGKQWESGHICDDTFRSELVEILDKAETKKIGDVEGVPAIRACPSCAQLIYHTEACKHMECKKCKKEFCFVCLKMKKDGNWQCGSHADVCPVEKRQNMQTLPDAVVINKKAFMLF